MNNKGSDQPAHLHSPMNTFVVCPLEGMIVKVVTCQRGSYMVWEINMGVSPRLEFDNSILFNCLGYDFYIYGAFEFLCYSIANL